MAPQKLAKRNLAKSEKELTLWPVCFKMEKVPDSYVSLSLAQSEFGISLKVCIF